MKSTQGYSEVSEKRGETGRYFKWIGTNHTGCVVCVKTTSAYCVDIGTGPRAHELSIGLALPWSLSMIQQYPENWQPLNNFQSLVYETLEKK